MKSLASALKLEPVLLSKEGLRAGSQCSNKAQQTAFDLGAL